MKNYLVNVVYHNHEGFHGDCEVCTDIVGAESTEAAWYAVKNGGLRLGADSVDRPQAVDDVIDNCLPYSTKYDPHQVRAAADLLAACQQAMEFFLNGTPVHVGSHAHQQIADAIRKATGKEPDDRS